MSNQAHLIAGLDANKALTYFDGVSADGAMRLDGHVVARCTGNGTATSFTIGLMPANVIVNAVNVAVENALGTAATTIAVGISGTTGKYMTATSFSSAMNSAGVKATTTLKIQETVAQTVLATFSAPWDTGAKAIVTVQYIRVPA